MASNKSFALKDTTINKIRIKKNLTIEEIANAMNKPRGTVGRWFSGVSVPRHNNAVILADILDMDYEYLLDAVKNDHERWKKHEKGCKAKLKGEPNNEVKEEKPNDICNLPKHVVIEIKFVTDGDIKYDEELNNYLDALDKQYSDFIQKWIEKRDKNELDEYISHLTEEEKDDFLAYLFWKMFF